MDFCFNYNMFQMRNKDKLENYFKLIFNKIFLIISVLFILEGCFLDYKRKCV